MRPTQARHAPTLTAPILLHAHLVLATTRCAWQMQERIDDSTLQVHASGRSPAPRRGVAVEVARLVSRVYRHANAPLRADMLACLLRPLGTLSLVGVASGAFATLLQHDGAIAGPIPIEMAARFSSDQIRELALFVHEVSPGVLAHLTELLSDGAMGAAALSASALILLYRRLRFTPEPAPSPSPRP